MSDLYKPVEDESSNTHLVIKMLPALKAEFSKHCEARGVNMSLVIRRFIESELASAKLAAQEPEGVLVIDGKVVKTA